MQVNRAAALGLLEPPGAVTGGICRAGRRGNNMGTEREDDISARERVERQLEQAVGDLRDAQRIGRMGSWRVDAGDGRWAWSPELCRLLGLTTFGTWCLFL